MRDHRAETAAAAAIQHIELAFAAATGDECLQALVLHLSQALGMDYAFVGELDEAAGSEGHKIITLAVSHQGRLRENFSYALQGSPCEQVVGHTTCTFPDGVRAAFPGDVLLAEMGIESYVGAPLFDSTGRATGLIVGMGLAPLANPELAASTVRIFAYRAAAEIERRGSQAEVAKLEAFYAQMLNNLPLDLAVFDVEGRFQYVNPAAVADPEMRQWLLGKTESEYCQRRGIDPLLARRRAAWRQEALTCGQAVHFEETLDRQGREQHMLRTLVPVRGADGQVRQVIGYGLDITDRLLAERRLRENEAVYRAMFEKNRVVKLLIDPATGEIVDANPAAAEFYGYPLAALRQTNIAAINTLPKETLFAEMASVLTHQRSHFHFQHRLASGEIREVEIHTGPLELGGRKLIFSIIRDETERKRAEEALRKSEAKYRRLFEQSKDAVLMTTPDGRLLDVNPAGLDLFAYPSREAALAADFSRDFYVEPWERDELKRLLAEQGFVKEFEIRFKTRQGRRLVVLGTYSAIRDDAGQIVAYLGILRDVTAQRHLEEQLRQSQKMEAVGRLAGGIAHDFNNLLTAINGYSDLLLQQSPEAPLRETYAQEIRRAGQRAADLTAKLLTLSRRKIVSPQVVDLNRVVLNLEGLLHRLIGEDVELVTRLEPELGRTRIDLGQIEQALLNLAVNARDAMPSGGRLTLETYNVELDESYSRRHVDVKAGSYVCLAVSDTGVGIGPEIQQHVFEPFFTTKEHGKGTGLGLSTVYATVRQSEGHIVLESLPQAGTTFRVFLPRVESRGASTGTAEASQVPALGGEETILLVEDDTSVRHLLRDLLRKQGYRVLEAEHGVAALELVDQHQEEGIDLLLSDVVMPAMSGPELADKLSPRYPGMRILFISGYTDTIIGQHGLSQARHLVLQKPFDARALSLKIREVLDPEASVMPA